MQFIIKTIGVVTGLALMATASPLAATIQARTPTKNGNFSDWCTNVYTYPGTTGTITAFCDSGHGITYGSHLDLNKCLKNDNGHVSRSANGNAMQSCTLGANGRNACDGCSTSIFEVTCRSTDGKSNITSQVNLDDYIGLTYISTTLNGNTVSAWVLSCTILFPTLGEFDSCTKSGDDDATCT